MADQEVIVKFRGDIRDLQQKIARLERQSEQAAQGMERGFNRASNRMRAGFARVAQAATVAFTAIGIGVAAAVRESASVEEIESKFQAVFRGLADETRAWSDETAEAINRSAISLREYASSLQDTFVPLGFARDEAAELSREVTELAVDLASFNNAAEPETVQLLTSALVGNHEAVRRFGVQITAARLEQELLSMGIEGGTRAATTQQAAMARLNLILSDTADANGDAARTADSATNRYRGFLGQVRDSAVAIGDSFMPAAMDALDWFTDVLPKIESVSVALGNAASALTNFFEGFDDMLARGDDIGAAFELRVAARGLEQGNMSFPRIRQMIDSAIGRDASADIFSQTTLGAPNMLERFTRGLVGISQRQRDELARALREAAERVTEGSGDFSDIWNVGDFVPTDEEAADAGELFMRGFFRPVSEGTEEVAKDLEALRTAAQAAGDGLVQSGLQEKLEEADESMKGMAAEALDLADADPFAKLAESVVTLQDALAGSIQAFEDALVDAITTGRLEFDDLARYIAAQFARIAVQQAITGPITALASSFFGGGPVGKNATGGPAKGLRLVGEQGPELAFFGQTANILTASQTRALGANMARAGGPGPSVAAGASNYNITNVTEIDARGAQEGVADQIARAVEGARQQGAELALATIAKAQRGRIA